MLADAVKFIGAVKDEWQLYSDNASDYTLGRPIGFGASSIVYEAEYHSPLSGPVPCALKVLDLDSLPMNSLRLLRKETQLMSLSKHPNVLRVRGTWIDGSKLYIALRLMQSGSVADVMQYGWPGGVEEEVAKCVLKQALEGLNYLHINGFIHRDVKAANLLIDDDGTVLLGDLGVATALNDEDYATSKGAAAATSEVASAGSVGKRKSFVGTPCWMAPEVVSQRHYDSKADIWSLGITALELAQGRAPHSREPSQKVLMKIIQDEPPTLDRDGGQFKYSKAFQEVIQSCLARDPSKRPSAEELLQRTFFRSSRKNVYLVGALLNGLPPLVDRQERFRIQVAPSRFSIESWDFSQGVVASSSASIRRKGLFDDGVFEMEERKDTLDFLDEENCTSEVRADAEDSGRGESTDETTSTPSTSLSLAPGSRLMKPVTPVSEIASHPIKGTSLSSSSGFWKKLKGVGGKGGGLDREKLQTGSPKTPVKGFSPPSVLSYIRHSSTPHSRSPR